MRPRRAKYRVIVSLQPGYVGDVLPLRTKADVDHQVELALKTTPKVTPHWAADSHAIISVEEYKFGQYSQIAFWVGKNGEWVKQR